jgi:hypothetical protein
VIQKLAVLKEETPDGPGAGKPPSNQVRRESSRALESPGDMSSISNENREDHRDWITADFLAYRFVIVPNPQGTLGLDGVSPHHLVGCPTGSSRVEPFFLE